MPGLIKPDRDLTLCPLCTSELEVQPPGAQSPTRCPKCEYLEPAGSAHLVTYLQRIMSEYCQKIGLSKAEIDDRDVPLDFCFKGNVFLSHFVTRGNELSAHIFPGQGFGNPLFTTRHDSNGLFDIRVVTTGSDPATLGKSLLWLVHSVHETLELSKSLNPAHSNSVLSLAFHPNHNQSLLSQMPGSALSDIVIPKTITTTQLTSDPGGLKHGR